MWLCARHPRLTVVALGILGIGHAAFWYAVRSAAFTHAAVAAAAGAN
jgi:hypothetical protein